MAEDCFKRKLSPGVYSMAERILHEQYSGDRGYNPGSQLIQIAGISVLDGLDHFIKEQLRAKFYIRDMDDFLIIHENAEYLENCRERIAERLSRLGFDLNPKKTRVYPLSEGVEFLGFNFSLKRTGKVVMTVRPDNVRRERRKLVRLVRKSIRGDLPRSKVDESYAAWRNHASKGDSFRLLQRMDAFYTSLWR